MMTRNSCSLLFAILLAPPAPAGPVDAQMDRIMERYFQIQTTLTKDSTQGVHPAAARIAELASEARPANPEVRKILGDLKSAAEQLRGKDLKQARLQFFELSKPIFVYLHRFYSGDKKYFRYFCTMEKKGWVQAQEGARNPYAGSAMLTCGDLVK